MDKLQELLEKVSQASGVDVNDLAQMEGETTKLYQYVFLIMFQIV